MNDLLKYGASERFKSEASLYPKFKLARVTAQYKGMYKIITDEEEGFAEVSGKFQYEISQLVDYPAVGDFVMVSHQTGDERAMIHHVLTRKSAFTRKAVGMSGQVQVVAANIDIIFICMSLNNNYNLSRLERYLSIAWDSGATPIIVLTKSDLCEDLETVLLEVERVSAFSEVITTTVFDENTVQKVRGLIKEGMTASLVGSSGVGKSTLINSLLGNKTLATSRVGKEDKGRHTTTGRELFLLPQGGIVIDTPGMREIGAESVDLSRSFVEIEDLAEDCKFGDCTHTSEPGCAVREAIETGLLDERRLENYFKLKREAKYEGLSSKEIEEVKLDDLMKDFGGMKKARKNLKKEKQRK